MKPSNYLNSIPTQLTAQSPQSTLNVSPSSPSCHHFLKALFSPSKKKCYIAKEFK